MLRGIGPLEIGLILVVVLVIFGPGKLPQVGSALGKSIREFRRASKGEDEQKEAAKAELQETQKPTANR